MKSEKKLEESREDLKKKGYALIRYDNGKFHSYPYDTPWINDSNFNKLYEAMRDNTLVDRVRCYHLYLIAQQVSKLPGDVLEVGTWRGGTAGIFAKVLSAKTIYIADTFEGVVKSSKWEHYKDKAHSDTNERVVTDLLENKLDTSNFKILKGIFPEETGSRLTTETLSLVYLDVDVYRSTKDAFNFIWERVVEGGVVVFDDYGMLSACAGIQKFINEIKDDADKLFIPNLNGQAYIIKVKA